MLSFALGTMDTNHPDTINDIGFFAQPGDDAANNGATIWMPAGTYIPKTRRPRARTIAAAKEFLAFIASPEGSDAAIGRVRTGGPVSHQGLADARRRVLPGVLDIQAYIDSNKASSGTGVRVAGQGPQPGADHGRGRYPA